MLNNIDLAARFIFMAERFKHIHETYEANVNFGEGAVYCTKNYCGTPTCHGGWALIALKPDPRSRKNMHYDHGAEILGKYLGFSGRHDFQCWAENNADIWGNDQGYWMFSSDGYKAFGKTYSMPLNLADIASWYLDVAQRLLKQTTKRKGR